MQMENLHTFATVECADEHANNATKNIHEYIQDQREFNKKIKNYL